MAKRNGVLTRIDPELDDEIIKVDLEMDFNNKRLSSREIERRYNNLVNLKKTKPKIKEDDIKF